MLASYSYLGLIGHPRIDAAADRGGRAVRHGRGRRAAAHRDERSARAPRDAHRRVHQARGRVRVLERLRHQRRDHHRADGSRATSSSWTSSTTRPSSTVRCCPARSGAPIGTTTWTTSRSSCARRARTSYGSTILVVADSVFSMDGDVMDLPTTKALCERYGARLMVDEAHSIGSLGATGHGIEEHFDMVGSIDLKMGTLSKSIPERRRLPGGRRRPRRLPAPHVASVHLLGGAAAGVDGRRARGLQRDRGRAVARDRAAPHPGPLHRGA